MALPTSIGGVLDRYLAAVDTALPGFVEGLYLVGSAALGDWRPPHSDIDAVVVSTVPADPDIAEVLAKLHPRRSKPALDGVFVTWDELAGPPDRAAAGPFSIDGRFYPTGVGPRVPITWEMLARHGISVRGPAVSEVEIRTDPQALTDWSAANLERFWMPRLDAIRSFGGAFRRAGFSDAEVAWTVLGIPRAAYTLRTGELTSKTEAGRHALRTFGEQWRPIVTEALRIRGSDPETGDPASSDPAAGREYRGRRGRRRLRERWRDMVAFADLVIADALDRNGTDQAERAHGRIPNP